MRRAFLFNTHFRLIRQHFSHFFKKYFHSFAPIYHTRMNFRNCRIYFSKSFIVLLFFLLAGFYSSAQQYLLPLDRQSAGYFDATINDVSFFHANGFHTSFRPYLLNNFPSTSDSNEVLIIETNSQSAEKTKPNGFFPCVKYHLFDSNLINVNKDDLILTVNPLIDFEYGNDFEHDRRTYSNSRGFRVTGTLGKKFSFETDYSENQVLFPQWIIDHVKEVQAFVPGSGKIKVYKTTGAYDFPSESGLIAWHANKHFDLVFGQGKNFIGDGYRSLLLSDNASAYPFLRLTTSAWKFQYTNMWAQMFDAKEKSQLGEGFRKKYIALHYLSTLIGRKIEIGLFEAVIWQAQDSVTYRGFDAQYLNPIIFYHSVQWNFGSPDNSMLGWNFRWNICHHLTFYNQFFLDDFNLSRTKKEKGYFGNKYAYQLGLKSYDAFKVKGLSLQAEYNEIWPYTYGHKLTTINYAHANQALADPVGSNSREMLGFIQYHFKNWFIGTEVMYVMRGIDSDTGNVGHDIFNSDYNIQDAYKQGTFVGTWGNYVGQGIPQTILYVSAKVNYLLNRHNNLLAEVSYTYRQENTDGKLSTTNFITFGIKTSLFNHYYDF